MDLPTWCKSCPYLVGVVSLNESAGGAYSGTLTAGDTGSIVKRHIEGLTDAGINTAVVCTDHGYVLLVTYGNASAAKNTLVVITNKVGCGIVKLIGGLEAAKGV